MKKHRLITVLIAALLIALCYGVIAVNQIPAALQYLFIAPEEAPQEELPWPTQAADSDPDVKKRPEKTQAQRYIENLAIESVEWQNIIASYTLTGIQEQTAFSSADGASIQGRLWAVSGGDAQVNHKTLLYGRNFYPEELSQGRAICLIDQQVAIALFRTGDAVGRDIQIAGKPYVVMGVLRHEKRVGDYEDVAVYIPLVTSAKDRIGLSTYMVTALPIKGSGAREAFRASMATYAPGGTMWDLNREITGATIMVRVFLFILGLFIVVRVVKYLNTRVMWFIADYRNRLMRIYAVRLLPRLIFFILLFTIGYALVSGLFAVLVWYVVEPVYIFPEWIPEVLVEWQDIRSAFWKVWQHNAMTLELRSPEILRIRFFATLLSWTCALCACLIPPMAMVAYQKKKHTKE